jgi:hypothetical protein
LLWSKTELWNAWTRQPWGASDLDLSALIARAESALPFRSVVVWLPINSFQYLLRHQVASGIKDDGNKGKRNDDVERAHGELSDAHILVGLVRPSYLSGCEWEDFT